MLSVEIRRATCAAAVISVCALRAEPAAAADLSGDLPNTEGVAQAVPAAAPGVIAPDSSIAAIMQAANLGEIRHSELALTRSGNPDVLSFAQRMIDDHSALLAQQTSLLARLGAVPLESVDSQALAATSAQQLASALSLSGPAFDAVYMGAQIVDHQTVLNLLDTQLIPQAQHPAVRDLLVSARPIVADHLALALQTQASLNGLRPEQPGPYEGAAPVPSNQPGPYEGAAPVPSEQPGPYEGAAPVPSEQPGPYEGAAPVPSEQPGPYEGAAPVPSEQPGPYEGAAPVPSEQPGPYEGAAPVPND